MSNWRSCGRPFTGVEVLHRRPDKAEFTRRTGRNLCARDVVMAGYWDDPAATDDAVRDGGCTPATSDTSTIGDSCT